MNAERRDLNYYYNNDDDYNINNNSNNRYYYETIGSGHDHDRRSRQRSCTLHKIAVVMQGLVYVFSFVSGPEATRLYPYYYTNCRGYKMSTI